MQKLYYRRHGEVDSKFEGVIPQTLKHDGLDRNAKGKGHILGLLDLGLSLGLSLGIGNMDSATRLESFDVALQSVGERVRF